MPRIASLMTCATVCATSVALAACGGHDDTTRLGSTPLLARMFAPPSTSREAAPTAPAAELVAFKRRYRRVVADAVPVARRLTATLKQARGARTVDWLVRRFGSLGKDMHRIHRRLARLKPPAGVGGAFARYVSGLGHVRRDLHAVATYASRNDAPQVRRAVRALVRDIGHAAPANVALNRKLGLSSQ